MQKNITKTLSVIFFLLFSNIIWAADNSAAAKEAADKAEADNIEKLNVYYGGFAFSGNYSDRQNLGKYTEKLTQKKSKDNLDIISLSLLKSIKSIHPKNFKILTDMPDLDKGDTESTVMSVVLDHESYSSEYEPITQTYLNNIDMFFQIMFYNFKSKKLIAAIPFDVEINTFSKNKYSDQEVLDMIEKFYKDGLQKADGTGTVNAFSQMESILNNFILREKYRFRIGVTGVEIKERAIEVMPSKIKNNLNTLKNIYAQSFSSRLSLHQSVALVPYVEGEAIGGKMKQRFVNSDEIYNISLPRPDFTIHITIRGYKKKLAKESDVTNIYLYGSYVNLEIMQPDIKKEYMNNKLKKGLQVKIPISITSIDDWRKFYASTAKLFDEFAINVSNPNSKWLNLQKTKGQSSGQVKNSLEKVAKVLNKVR